MNLWLILTLLVILGFIIVESYVMRNNTSKRDKINFFLTLHRITIQRQALRVEDVISLAGFVFIVLLGLLIAGSRFSISLETGADAQVLMTPKIAEQIIRKESVDLVQEKAVSNNVQSVTDGFSVLNARNLVLDETPYRSYEENVFDAIPARIVDHIQWEAEDFMIPVGQKVLGDNASGGIAVRALKSDNVIGDLAVSDPTTLQRAGRYKVHFKLKFSDSTQNNVVARIHIVDEHEGQSLFVKEVRGIDFDKSNEYQYIDGSYIREYVGSTQIRIEYLGVGDLYFDKVEIEPISLESKIYENLQFYADVPDVDASNGITRLASSVTDIPGRIAFGPYDDSVGEGRYQARFRMKVADNTRNQRVALIDVSSNGKGFTPDYRDIFADDFSESGVYQDFVLTFDKPADGYLDFRVYYYGVTDLSFDTVRLYRFQ